MEQINIVFLITYCCLKNGIWSPEKWKSKNVQVLLQKLNL